MWDILPLSTARKLRNEQNLNFKELLLQSISRKFLSKSTTLSFHLLHTAEVRLASYLYSVSHDAEGNRFRECIPKQEFKAISECIGITVRHQNRCFQSLERNGIVRRETKCIRIVDARQLLEHAQQNIYEIQ